MFKTLLFFDIAILILHVLFGSHSTFFHLDYEQNLPTIYQSLKLILFGVGILLSSLTLKLKNEIRLFSFSLALFVIFIGFDELLQIHENIYRVFEFFEWLHPSRVVDQSLQFGYRSSLWIIYYIPAVLLFFVWCGYWFRYFQSKLRSNISIIFFCGVCVGAVFIAEILSTTGLHSDRAYFGFITIEETAEMLLASTLVYLGLRTMNKPV